MHPAYRFACAALLAAPAAAQLAGVYTVNPAWPVFSTNYTSLAGVVQDLATLGVAGPVFIEVYDDAGPFNESHPFVTSNVQWAPSDAALTLGQWTGVSSINRVTFRAAAGEAPVLDATGRAMGVFFGGADYVTIEGFEIRNAIFDAVTLYSETAHGVVTDAILRNCRIHHCGSTGVTIYGNSSLPVNTLIENNVFWHLQTATSGGFNTTARFGYITTRRSTNSRIVHNTFFVDTAAGAMACAIGSNESSTTAAPYAEISNNVFLKIGAVGKPLFRLQTPTGSSALVPPICDSNCFFDVTASPFALYGAAGVVVANTLLDWQQNALRDLASLGVDPQMVDPQNGEFHLAVTSPCIAASTVAAGVGEDFDNQPRGAVADIGADEYSAARIAPVGTGCAGTRPLAPVMTWIGWPFLGSQTFALAVHNMPPSQPMLVFASFGTTLTPFPLGFGCNVFLPLANLTGIPLLPTAGPAGTASMVIPWPANAGYIGVNFGFQAAVIDPGAPLGVAVSNALDVVLDF